MNNQEDLVGRYLKRVHRDYCELLKIGDYVMITKNPDKYMTCYTCGIYGIVHMENEDFELMPVGFDPNNINTPIENYSYLIGILKKYNIK